MGDCPERREITFFYSDAGLPTLGDTKNLRNVQLINTFHNSLDTLLHSNPLSSITGHWYSCWWVNARAQEWYEPAIETAFQATLTATQTIHMSPSERLIEDWRANFTPPPPRDPRRHYAPLRDPPDLLLHPFTNRVLAAQSRAYQSAAFQIITGHAFNATYSSRFRKNANDNTTCPHCGDRYTINHVLFDCEHFWYE